MSITFAPSHGKTMSPKPAQASEKPTGGQIMQGVQIGVMGGVVVGSLASVVAAGGAKPSAHFAPSLLIMGFGALIGGMLGALVVTQPTGSKG